MSIQTASAIMSSTNPLVQAQRAFLLSSADKAFITLTLAA